MKKMLPLLAAVTLFAMVAAGCGSPVGEGAAPSPTATLIATATPRPAALRAVDAYVDTTSSQTPDQIAFNLNHLYEVMRKAAAGGDEWIMNWLNTLVMDTQQTFNDTRFPDPAVFTTCVSPTPAPPFVPPPDVTDYEKCGGDNRERQRQFVDSVAKTAATAAVPTPPPVDETSTPIFAMLLKAQERLGSFPDSTTKVALVYSDLQDNVGPVTLNLHDIHVIVVLAIRDAATYEQAREQWAGVLDQSGAASVQFFYPGTPTDNIVAAIPAGN